MQLLWPWFQSRMVHLRKWYKSFYSKILEKKSSCTLDEILATLKPPVTPKLSHSNIELWGSHEHQRSPKRFIMECHYVRKKVYYFVLCPKSLGIPQYVKVWEKKSQRKTHRVFDENVSKMTERESTGNDFEEHHDCLHENSFRSFSQYYTALNVVCTYIAQGLHTVYANVTQFRTDKADDRTWNKGLSGSFSYLNYVCFNCSVNLTIH